MIGSISGYAVVSRFEPTPIHATIHAMTVPNPSSSPAHSAPPLAVVTGASSGIGAATATLLAQRGYRTILIARRTERIAALAQQLSSQARSVALTLDLEQPDLLEPAMRGILAEHGPIDLLINNAGGNTLCPTLDLPMDAHQRLMQVHYFAPLALIRATLPGMLERRRGHVINITSIATKMGPWGHGAYAAAKSALVSLTQSLAAEYGDQGVRFSYVKPGVVKTEFFDGPGYKQMSQQVETHGISADVVARKIVGLLDRPRLELCVPRHYRVLDWIKAIHPGLAHALVTRNSRPRKKP